MEINQLPDAELVRQYTGGKEDALEVLIKRYQSKVFGFILTKLEDTDLANDIFQETFIKVIHTLKLNKYNEEGKFLSWVIRIAHNLIMDHYRREKRVKIINETEENPLFKYIKDESDSVEDEMIHLQLTFKLQQMIAELPKDQQEVIRMRLYQDLSFKEIAEATDVSINTALGRMRYALLNLRKQMDGKNLAF